MTSESRIAIIFFSSVAIVAILMLWLIGGAWGEDGPWRILVSNKHYGIYDVKTDTVSVEDFTLDEVFYDKSVARDFAEALNEAHERRTQKIGTERSVLFCECSQLGIHQSHVFDCVLGRRIWDSV